MTGDKIPHRKPNYYAYDYACITSTSNTLLPAIQLPAVQLVDYLAEGF